VVTLTRVKTSSGVLSASGKARIANRKIEAEFLVDLVDGVIGVPLVLSGPVDKIQVSVPAGALAGAATGTVVLPGIGTAIGARTGTALGKIFGSGPDDKNLRLQPPAHADTAGCWHKRSDKPPLVAFLHGSAKLLFFPYAA
jgi:hypothetical protein